MSLSLCALSVTEFPVRRAANGAVGANSTGNPPGKPGGTPSMTGVMEGPSRAGLMRGHGRKA
jgi:hypothetical protein